LLLGIFPGFFFLAFELFVAVSFAFCKLRASTLLRVGALPKFAKQHPFPGV
jgi:hypothetical protein